MRCPECEHENTEGAWLCINCGHKLPRPETQDSEQDEQGESSVSAQPDRDEPSRFAPQVSENLRRLRDQAERERARRQVSGTGGAAVLGIPLTVWALIAFLLVLFVVLMSSLQ